MAYNITCLDIVHVRKHNDLEIELLFMLHHDQECILKPSTILQVVAHRKFSLVCFRLLPPQNNEDLANKLNRDLLDSVNSSGKIFISHTVWSNLCFLSPLMPSLPSLTLPSFHLLYHTHLAMALSNCKPSNRAGSIQQIHSALCSRGSFDRREACHCSMESLPR